jgi:hypothetical protein
MARNEIELAFSPYERVGALGKTGSGKTFLMQRLVRQFEDQNIAVLIVDTKHSINMFGFLILYDEEKAVKDAAKGKSVIFRPGRRGGRKKNVGMRTKPTDNFYRMIWAKFGSKTRGDLLLYIDEAAHVTSANSIPEPLQLLVQAGREVGIGVWWSGQQGTGVNNWLISQTEKIMVFRLTSGSDRSKMEKFLTESVQDAGTLPPHHFHAYGFPEVEGIESDEGTETYIVFIPDEGEKKDERNRQRESVTKAAGVS